MTEPRRILEEDPDGDGAWLLRSAKNYAPPPNAHRQVLAGLGLAAGATTVTASKAAVILGFCKTFAASKTGLIVLAVAGSAVVASGVYEVRQRAAGPTPVAVPRAPEANVADRPSGPGGPGAATPVLPAPAGIASAVLAERVPAPFVDAEPSGAGREPSAPTASTRPATPLAASPARTTDLVAPIATVATVGSVGPVGTVAAPVDALASELAILDDARAAEARSDPRAALAKLDEHDRRFPAGALAQQAELLRIDVLAASGDAGEARARGARFLAAHPRSVLAGRVREIVERLDRR